MKKLLFAISLFFFVSTVYGQKFGASASGKTSSPFSISSSTQGDSYAAYKFVTTGNGGEINLQQGFMAPIWFNSTYSSGFLSLNNTPVDFYGTTSDNASGTVVSIYNVTTGQYLYKQVIPPATIWYAPSFNPAAGNIYRFIVADL